MARRIESDIKTYQVLTIYRYIDSYIFQEIYLYWFISKDILTCIDKWSKKKKDMYSLKKEIDIQVSNLGIARNIYTTYVQTNCRIEVHVQHK